MRKLIGFSAATVLLTIGTSISGALVPFDPTNPAPGYGIESTLTQSPCGSFSASIALTALESGRRVVTVHAQLVPNQRSTFTSPLLPGLEIRALVRPAGTDSFRYAVELYRLGILESRSSFVIATGGAASN